MNEAPKIFGRDPEEYRVEMRGKEAVVTRESIFQMVRSIRDPEHSYSLEQLNVVALDRIRVFPHVPVAETNMGEECAGQITDIPYMVPSDQCSQSDTPIYIEIVLIPTIPHCSLIGIIGLSVLYKVSKMVSSKYIVRVVVPEDAHMLGVEMSRQLEDIERTSCAFSNPTILETLQSLM